MRAEGARFSLSDSLSLLKRERCNESPTPSALKRLY